MKAKPALEWFLIGDQKKMKKSKDVIVHQTSAGYEIVKNRQGPVGVAKNRTELKRMLGAKKYFEWRKS